MNVDAFIARYQQEWHTLDDACKQGRRGLLRRSGEDLDRLIGLYVRASAHLAEAQTRYHDPQLRSYLNDLVSRAQAVIYGTRTASFRELLRLFGSRYRAAIRETAPFIAIAAIVMLGVMFATLFWVAGSPEARDGLLPPFAREAAQRAGGEGGIEGISPGSVSVMIMLNNVQVALIAFALGITFGVGTIYILVQNALFIGGLAGAFHAAGRAELFWTLVLPHGFLELMAIFIAAGAGLRIGWSLVDPGDRPRGEALGDEARGAVMVLLGVVPAFVLAALIEGFLTPTKLRGPLTIGIGAAVAVAYAVFLAAPRRDDEDVTAVQPP